MFKNREVVIIGHGPSTLGRGLGKEIDKYKRVVRLKATSEKLLVSNPADYGTKRDILCGSWTIRNSIHNLKADEYWVFLDSRHKFVRNFEIVTELSRSMVVPEVCDIWTKEYLKTRNTQWKRDKLQVKSGFSDDLGHLHMSAGMYSILYTCWILQPTSIHLVGFDSLTTGTFSKSLSRPEDWVEYPDHRWDIEKIILEKLKNHFCVNIGSL